MNKTKTFIFSITISLLWAMISVYMARLWFNDITIALEFMGPFAPIMSGIMIGGIAIVPGFLNAFLVSSLLINNTKDDYIGIDNIIEPVTVLVPIHNEEKIIYEVIEKIYNQTYKGKINIIVINNNSIDNGVCQVRKAINDFADMSIRLIDETKPGKNFALNKGLKYVDTKYVITIDGDTLLHKDAIMYIAGKMIKSGDNTFGVAGSLLVLNPEDNLVTKAQQLDYYMSITAIKRMQSMYDSTLVCQGAFSIYNTELVKKYGGWSDAIGEDIVLTTDGLADGYNTYFEPHAVAWTDVPTKLSHFTKQRSRWARGMIEFLRKHKISEFSNKATKLFVLVDICIIYIDFSYTFFYLPGLIMAIFFHNYLIVGPMALLVLSLTFISFSILSYRQKQVLKELNIEHKISILGAILFCLAYQTIMSPTSLKGYIEEVINAKRVWE